MNRQLSASVRGLVASLTCLLLLLSLPAFGQAPAATFEVASIKPAQEITPAMILSGKLHLGMSVDGARVDIGYASLADLIPLAYNVKPYQVAGPDWMRSQRFDIMAKLPEGATKEQVPQMLQALLEERFKLKAHKENRDNNVYALVVAKSGSKLKEAEPEPETKPAPSAGAITLNAGGQQLSVNPGRGGMTVTSSERGNMKVTPGPEGQMHLALSKVSMPQFAEMLTPLVDRPVVDMTEFKGNYQVEVDVTLDTMLNMARGMGIGIPGLGAARGVGGDGRLPVASDPSNSSIFTSIQQLGLRLESRRSPVETVVVDSAEKNPTEN
jgi:uncharacterized protein (TIGR03435 family)